MLIIINNVIIINNDLQNSSIINDEISERYLRSIVAS